MTARRKPARDAGQARRPPPKRAARTRPDASARHELRVYQEELEAQNEALRDAQNALEVSRDRFVELYDFAPNGYVTLDENGVIGEINLTGAAWLGKRKEALHGLPFFGFIAPSSR